MGRRGKSKTDGWGEGEVRKGELGPAVVPDERYYGAARMRNAEKKEGGKVE